MVHYMHFYINQKREADFNKRKYIKDGETNDNFESFCRSLIKRGQGWNTDELFFGEYVNKFKFQDRIIKLSRGWSNGIAEWRIDRVHWQHNYKIENYLDSHLLRPYSNYKEIIDKLIEDLVK